MDSEQSGGFFGDLLVCEFARQKVWPRHTRWWAGRGQSSERLRFFRCQHWHQTFFCKIYHLQHALSFHPPFDLSHPSLSAVLSTSRCLQDGLCVWVSARACLLASVCVCFRRSLKSFDLNLKEGSLCSRFCCNKANVRIVKLSSLDKLKKDWGGQGKEKRFF